MGKAKNLYEKGNHLGNVLVTISDKKLQHSTDGTTVDYYNADIITANDFYPFGSQMPGRKYSQPNTKYRYGFNGKENDSEVKGEGNQQDYGMRIYDTRLGRFLSRDPLSASYPYYSPYHFAGNTPIQAIDLDGEEPVGYSTSARFKHPGREWIRTVDDSKVGSNVQGQWFKMQIKDAVAAQWTVFRKETQEIASYGGYHKLETRVDFYYLDNSVNAPTPGNNYVTNPAGAFAGNLIAFDARERTDMKQGSAIADGFQYMALGIVAAPAALAAAPTVGSAISSYGTTTLSFGLTERAVGVGINAGFQYLQNAPNKGWGLENIKNMNGTSLFLTGLNPEAVAVNAIGSNFGKLTIADRGSKSVLGSGFNLREASVGAAIDFTGGKMGKGLENLALKYGGLKPLQSSTLGNVLSGTATTPANTINDEANKKTP